MNKSEIIKEALNDVINTIRAQDNKISYIIAIVIFIFSGFIFVTNTIMNPIYTTYDFLIYLSPLLLLTIGIYLYFTAFKPITNPDNILSEEDKIFAINKFFIVPTKETTATKLTNDLNLEITSENDCLRLMYIEVIKLSYIRDTKIKKINIGNHFVKIGCVLMFIQIITLFKYSMSIFLIVCAFIAIKIVYSAIDYLLK